MSDKPEKQFEASIQFGDGYTSFVRFDYARDFLKHELGLLQSISDEAQTNDIVLSKGFEGLLAELVLLIDLADKLAKSPVVGAQRTGEFIKEFKGYFKKVTNELAKDVREKRLAQTREALADLRIDDANDAFMSFSNDVPLTELSASELSSFVVQKALARTREISGGDIDDLNEDLEQLNSKTANLDKRIESILENQKAQVDENAKYRELYNEFKTEIEKRVDAAENVKEAHEQSLRLSAASRFWGIKQRRHGRRMKWLVFGLILWLFGAARILSNTLQEYRYNVQNAKDFYDLVPHLPTNILLVLLVVWGARVLTRLVLSENHMATRAEEKGVLIQTYLALVKKGHADEKDRGLILGSIFTHTQDGLVPDDGMPAPGPMNYFTKNDS